MNEAPASWLDALRDEAARLDAAGVEGAVREARLLLAHALGTDGAGVIQIERDVPGADALARFKAVCAMREARMPLSRIRQMREFYGRSFYINAHVLDPRPDTEILVEEAVRCLPEGGSVLDLGTGSGCILGSVLAERLDGRGVGVDLSPDALVVAQRNLEALGVGARSRLIEGSWGGGAGEMFDLVVSNPPYIRVEDMIGLAPEVLQHDPEMALTDGGDGLGAYREIVALAPSYLRDGGWLLMEVGAGQAGDIEKMMVAEGFSVLESLKDLAGHQRVVRGQKQT